MLRAPRLKYVAEATEKGIGKTEDTNHICRRLKQQQVWSNGKATDTKSMAAATDASIGWLLRQIKQV